MLLEKVGINLRLFKQIDDVSYPYSQTETIAE
jgi:hypothetical protein